ncbi:hypothetical protein [Parvularcula dongshanensis]|uniref:Membrane protein implicated in regulation of membrane protease activity n=1 Tax=Parvularcula dongshanensis TaxID=1173995 RepID=A0A840I4N5_9PROT|nr:hypothetical protein [Parvularcula dongshanensis]MBB4659809.1 membrane protein implicated in regulation of membrane protease activity [Parvularcula dongshanensis]
MSLGNLALAGICVLALVYAGFIVGGLIAAWPWGIIGLAVLGFFAFLFGAVLRQRLRNPEDRYYEREVKE